MKENTHSICRDIFKAVHEGKWLSIEYENKKEEISRFWIAIKNINPLKRTISVDGLHLGKYTIDSFDTIYIDSIHSASIIDGSYCERNEWLISDISVNPEKYAELFDNVANLKILNYLEDCNRMDASVYKSDFELVKELDHDKLTEKFYSLTDAQFCFIVKNFQSRANTNGMNNKLLQQLAMNILSINTTRGLYVLAYKKLQLDVKRKRLVPEKEITICTENTIDGTKESIRGYLDADEYELLADFEHNAELIKDLIQKKKRGNVDDMPYVIGLGMEIILDLHKEYKAILDMYSRGNVSIPLQAFFGNLVKRPQRRKEYPIALLQKQINIDQLLAINKAMKYPVAYIQGPPGTGKTNTIINTISTAFFNGRTVLFTSYNNHPIDGVFEKLTNLRYQGKIIPFPVVRLGSNQYMKQTLKYIKTIYENCCNISVFEKTLDKNREERVARAKDLSNMLKKYDDILDLRERQDAINRLADYENKEGNDNYNFALNVSLANQKQRIDAELQKMGQVEEENVLKLLDVNDEDFQKYLYYTSAKYIKNLEKKCKEVLDILLLHEESEQVDRFNKYLSNGDNLKCFLQVFPIVVTTCVSAHKLGEPDRYFDMVIMDEASQCNTAVSLVPILRGENLMLVGDPQQLNPVILLNRITNGQLKKKYKVADEYDYCENSIYKTFLACDSVSDEVLLHNHYRCNRKIIGFNNKKYYNNQLKILSGSKNEDALLFVDVRQGETNVLEKNTSYEEACQIIEYCKANPNKSIGIITPFVNQKNMIEHKLDEVRKEIDCDISCGTVHSFQGDEKDVILFSTAITNATSQGTYNWLKNNKELINVATSRAKEELIIFASEDNVKRLHGCEDNDDLYELICYTKSNGRTEVTPRSSRTRALGIKPYSSSTEEAFLENLSHALGILFPSQNRYSVKKEVGIAHVFQDNTTYSNLFYSGRFDFVVYEKQGKMEIPVLVIELDGKEHYDDEIVKERDEKKNQICKEHNLQLIRIENSYARRYNYMKDILSEFFKSIR